MTNNRRQFLKLSACSLAVLTGAKSHALPVDKPSKFDESYDVVVIGAGGAGLAAAVHGGLKKASMVVIEKLGFPGGGSLVSGGNWSVSGTEMQKEKNIQDSAQLYEEDMLKEGGGFNDPELVKLLVKVCKDEYDWILAHGVKPVRLTANSGMSVPRCHLFDPAALVQLYFGEAKKLNVPFKFNTKAEHLLWDNDKKKIVGVQVIQKGKPVNIEARKAVILTTGGFARSKEYLEFSPKSINAVPITGAGSTGDGLRMAQEYGAALRDMAFIKPTYGFMKNPSTIKDKTCAFYTGAIMVNRAGKRFVNESISYKKLGEIALSQENSESFLVLDDRIRRLTLEKDPREPRFMGKKGETDFGFVGNTIEEVAEKAGINPQVLAETVKKYNELAPKGEDEFGRKHLTSSYGTPTPLVEPPFLILPATAALLTTFAGLKVDPKLRVIDVFNNPIGGLYAAGEVCGGFHGSGNMSGTGISKAYGLGRTVIDNVLEL